MHTILRGMMILFTAIHHTVIFHNFCFCMMILSIIYYARIFIISNSNRTIISIPLLPHIAWSFHTLIFAIFSQSVLENNNGNMQFTESCLFMK